MARMPSRPTTNRGRSRATRFSSFGSQNRNKKGQFVGGKGFAWVGLSGVIKNMEDVSETFYKRTRREGARLAERMEAYGRANARWEDRTGDARAGLRAVVVDSVNGTGFTIAFGHSVYYGYFLENRYGGKYAIIQETVNWAQDQLGQKMATEVWAR